MLVLDCETTTLNKGNPFDHRNSLCYIGMFDGSAYNLHDIEYSRCLNKEELVLVRDRIHSVSLLVLFNAKFDLHWLRRYGIDFSHCDIWDCQLVEFILSNQSNPYPSLGDTALKYSLGTKLDVVNRDYWSKEIDTPDVPRDILEEYLQQDLFLTHQIYLQQKKEINGC